MPKFKEKNTIEKVFNDGRDMIPFVTTEGGIAYGIGEIEKNKAAQLTFEEEVNKRVEEELLKRGVTDPSLMGALDFTQLASQVYGTGNDTDNTMPQITENSRDVSPSHDSKNQGDMTQEQFAAASDKKQGREQKKNGRTLDSQERDSKEKARGDLEAGVREIAKDMPNEERAVAQDDVNREAVQEVHSENRQPKIHGKEKETMQRSGKARTQAAQRNKTEQNKEKDKAPRTKTEQHVVAKEMHTIRANDYEGHDVKKETEKVEARRVNMDKGAGFGNLAAALARGQEDTKASNLLTAAVGITAQTGRTTEFLQGNDKLQLRRDPTDGCTYAFINDKKVGGDQAKDFLLKMNRELGPEKAEQLRTVVDLAKNNPNIDKNMGQEQKQNKSHDIHDRG